jgi:hypothetical protein
MGEYSGREKGPQNVKSVKKTVSKNHKKNENPFDHLPNPMDLGLWIIADDWFSEGLA